MWNMFEIYIIILFMLLPTAGCPENSNDEHIFKIILNSAMRYRKFLEFKLSYFLFFWPQSDQRFNV